MFFLQIRKPNALSGLFLLFLLLGLFDFLLGLFDLLLILGLGLGLEIDGGVLVEGGGLVIGGEDDEVEVEEQEPEESGE